jgi:hypothetical protein
MHDGDALLTAMRLGSLKESRDCSPSANTDIIVAKIGHYGDFLEIVAADLCF